MQNKNHIVVSKEEVLIIHLLNLSLLKNQKFKAESIKVKLSCNHIKINYMNLKKIKIKTKAPKSKLLGNLTMMPNQQISLFNKIQGKIKYLI